MKSVIRWSVRVVLALLAFVACAVIAILVILRKGLPVTEGVVRLEDLSAPVGITRDARDVPTIDASNRADAARALGFLHGQERFFQMDLMRRAAAGELSALFGKVALRADRQLRIHRFRAAAQRAVEGMPAGERAVVAAYADGVNAGLGRLRARPFEYWVLRAEPEPWLPEDTVLVNFAMWLDLQESNGEPDRSRAVVRDVFSPEAAAWLLSPADPFQAAIDGTIIEAPPMPDSPGAPPVFAAAPSAGPANPPPPVALSHLEAPAPAARVKEQSQSTLDLHSPGDREGARLMAALFPERDPDFWIGSNSWAVAGSHTAGGAALVANDMHLGFRMPHIWYRASMVVGNRRIDGITLPGTPAFIIGSNGRVAWSFTNSETDTADVVIVEPDPADRARYLAPGGSEAFQEFAETISVKGGGPETLAVRWTRWGPVIGNDHRGRTVALAWTAHQPGAANLDLMQMEGAQNTAEALGIAQRSGMPAQNFIAGDSAGAIGWTIAGHVPRRTGLDGTAPDSLAHGGGWDGWLAPDEVPAILDPADGILWSANARVVGDTEFRKLGDGGYAPSSRAARIRDRLLALNDATPADMLALQLDNRSLPMDFWRDLLIATLAPARTAADPGRETMRRLAIEWNGDADAASAGYRLIREFRREAINRTTRAVFARCREAFPEFRSGYLTEERIVRDLVSARPPAWLPADHAGWDALLLGSVDTVIADAGGPTTLERYTWGNFNRLSMRHPLSAALPLAGRWLDMRPVPMSGDGHAVNAQLRGHGSSERMAVSPGDEAHGILHLPGGQSGNPLSPHYDDGHAAWVRGEPVPLQPGPAVVNLLLTPPEK